MIPLLLLGLTHPRPDLGSDPGIFPQRPARDVAGSYFMIVPLNHEAGISRVRITGIIVVASGCFCALYQGVCCGILILKTYSISSSTACSEIISTR